MKKILKPEISLKIKRRLLGVSLNSSFLVWGIHSWVSMLLGLEIASFDDFFFNVEFSLRFPYFLSVSPLTTNAILMSIYAQASNYVYLSTVAFLGRRS